MNDELGIKALGRVVVTRPAMLSGGNPFGLFIMQVCAVPDAEDKEILAVCNRDNPSGTTYGWQTVVRNNDDEHCDGPGPCEDYPGRIHYLVKC